MKNRHIDKNIFMNAPNDDVKNTTEGQTVK